MDATSNTSPVLVGSPQMEDIRENLVRTQNILSYSDRQAAHQLRAKNFPKLIALTNSTKVKAVFVVASVCWMAVIVPVFVALGVLIAPENNIGVVAFWIVAGIAVGCWAIAAVRNGVREFLSTWENTTRDMLNENSIHLLGRPLEVNDLR